METSECISTFLHATLSSSSCSKIRKLTLSRVIITSKVHSQCHIDLTVIEDKFLRQQSNFTTIVYNVAQ